MRNLDITRFQSSVRRQNWTKSRTLLEVMDMFITLIVHQTVHFKYVQFLVYKLYLRKAVLK